MSTELFGCLGFVSFSQSALGVRTLVYRGLDGYIAWFERFMVHFHVLKNTGCCCIAVSHLAWNGLDVAHRDPHNCRRNVMVSFIANPQLISGAKRQNLNGDYKRHVSAAVSALIHAYTTPSHPQPHARLNHTPGPFQIPDPFLLPCLIDKSPPLNSFLSKHLDNLPEHPIRTPNVPEHILQLAH